MTNEDKSNKKEVPEELTPEIKAMLDQRIERANANPNEGKSWEEVLAEARARWKK